MKTIRRTSAEIENEKAEKIAALQQFKKGDRVFNKLTKKHGVFHSKNLANAMPSCWVRFDELLDDEWVIPPEKDPGSADPLNLELCHCNKPIPPIHDLQLHTASQEEAVTAKAQLEPDTALCGLSSPTDTLPVSTAKDSPTLSLLKPTSENLQTNLFPLSPHQTSLSSAALVQTFPSLDSEPDLMAVAQACFLKDSDFCDFKSLRLSFLKMSLASSAVITEMTSTLFSVPSRNWGMWGHGKNAMESATFPKIESGSSFWVLTGNVQCKKVEATRSSLDECLDTPGVILDRHISGDRIYDTIAPTIRSCAKGKNGHQSGGGQYKVVEYKGEEYLVDGVSGNEAMCLDGTGMLATNRKRPVNILTGKCKDLPQSYRGNPRPLTGNEFERLMGWELDSTATGVTKEGEVVAISTTQRHRMLGNGIIPAEIEDICNSLRPFLEEVKNSELVSEVKEVPIGTSLAHVVNVVMDEAEATSAIAEINNACSTIRELLCELDSRQGYIALGFANMTQLLRSNLFTKARSTLQKELQAGRIEEKNLNVPIGTFSESQLRSLSKLKDDYRPEAIVKAKEIAGDRPLTAKDISQSVAEITLERPETRARSIVDIVKEKTFVPLSELGEYAVGDIVVVKASGKSTLRSCDGYWGIVERISHFAYHICISVKEEKISDGSGEVTLLCCKGDEVEKLELNDGDKLLFRSVSDRIKKLVWRNDLDTSAWWILEGLSRQTFFTQEQMALLEFLEARYECK